MSNDEMITIPKKTYLRLLDSEAKLSALESLGVDNWSGYGEAMKSMYDKEGDEI